MVKCGVLFEVRTEFLNIIYTNIGFKGLILHLFTHTSGTSQLHVYVLLVPVRRQLMAEVCLGFPQFFSLYAGVTG
jgi:hypothetical protein